MNSREPWLLPKAVLFLQTSTGFGGVLQKQATGDEFIRFEALFPWPKATRQFGLRPAGLQRATGSLGDRFVLAAGAVVRGAMVYELQQGA